MTSRTRYTIAALFVLLQLADVLTTTFALRNGAVEANPVAATLMQAHGEPAVYAVKLLAALGVLGVVVALRRPRLWLAPRIANALMLLVVMVNLTALL